MRNDLFVKVTKQEYEKFLAFLNKNCNGYRYVPNIMASKTSIYFIDDNEHKNEVGYRKIGEYGNLDAYFIKNDVYCEGVRKWNFQNG